MSFACLMSRPRKTNASGSREGYGERSRAITKKLPFSSAKIYFFPPPPAAAAAFLASAVMTWSAYRLFNVFGPGHTIECSPSSQRPPRLCPTEQKGQAMEEAGKTYMRPASAS